MIEETLNDLEKAFEKVIANYEKDLSKVRTGRANLALLDGVKVDYYGVPTPLSQVAAVAVADPRLITIRPWEKKLIPAIEKAIGTADIGLNPSNDGDLVRLPIPTLTTERRKDLAKQVRRMAEEGKIALRNVRREHRSRLEKAEGLPEDDQKRAMDRIDKVTETYVSRIDEITATKEEEIMSF
ncbi:MAG: ribosome recycling factor [Deltaproteobacteria bacterium]|nr:ribosome recycling factor [Deltaproteobacteria bacterium]